MCLIAIKPKGVEAYDELFIEGLLLSSKNNSDGIGFAYKKDGEGGVHYEKGFANIVPFIDKLRALELKKGDELIVHLRRASTGRKDASSCHPFVLSNIDRDVDSCGPCKTYNTVLFHNGHLSSFIDTSGEFSDTYMFSKLFMRNKDVLDLLYKDKELFLQCFSLLIRPERNRMAFLSHVRERNLVTIGSFIEDKGYLFSNLSYKDGNIINAGGITITPDKNTSPMRGFNLAKNITIDSMQKRLDTMLGYNDTNIPKLTLCASNFFEVILIAQRALADLNIESGSKWTLSKWMPERKCLQLLNNFENPSIFAWVDMESIKEDFIIVPKLTYMNKYKDYYRITHLIQPTKSAVKKIHDKINSIARKKGKLPDYDQLIDIKYKNRPFTLRYDAICMFIRDNIKLLGGYANIPTLKEDEPIETPTKNEEVVKKLKDFREIKQALKTKTDEELSQEIINNEKVVNESLDKFVQKRLEEIEANKVDSNNGEEINPQEERELNMAAAAQEGLIRCTTN